MVYNGVIKIRLGQEIKNQSNKQLIDGSLERRGTIDLYITMVPPSPPYFPQ
jgi:hypothetical protein